MMNAGERAYIFAKACGIISKSFVGRRTASLRSVSRLSELDRLVFGPEARELPERELLPDLERRFSRRSVEAVLSVVNSCVKPPLLLKRLLQAYEYADLKTALSLIIGGGSAVAGGAAAGGDGTAGSTVRTGPKPDFVDLKRFGTVRFNAWPNAAAMLGGTEFAFLLDKKNPPTGLKSEFDGVSLETALDRRYYSLLWKSLEKLRKGDCRAAEKITAEEIALRNCAWVLRLRTYYGMSSAAAASHLVLIKKHPRLSADAREALELPLDNRAAWEGWKRAAFLNPQDNVWQANPRYFQNAASAYLYRLASHAFRRAPSSLDTAFCFIKLKQFEEDLLTSSAEGLGMGMAGKDVLLMLGAQT